MLEAWKGVESLPWEREKWEMELVFRNVSDAAETHVKGRRVGGPGAEIDELQNHELRKALDICL